MSTEQPIDPQAIEETKAQIRGLVHEISQLTKQGLEPEVFYGEFLQRVVSALAAIGGAVWIVSPEGPLRLIYQIRLRECLPEEQGGADAARHARLLHRVLNGNEELLVPPYSGGTGDDQAGNPTSHLLVLCPIRDEQRMAGVVEVFQRPTSGPASQRGYLRFLAQMCALIGDYLQSRRLRELMDWQTLFSRTEQFARTIHDSLDASTTAYTIANEGRRLVGVDRVSVALRKGRKYVVEAISGQDTMDKRANSVLLLNRLATAVCRNGEPLWYTGPTDHLAPQIETALQAYVDEVHAKSVAVLPLRSPAAVRQQSEQREEEGAARVKEEVPFGALIIEQIEDNRPAEAFRQSVDLVTEHSARALSNAMAYRSLFLLPLWQFLGKARWVVAVRNLPKSIAAALLVLGAIAALCLVPYRFDMKCEGELQPVLRRQVFVDTEAVVTEVSVTTGQQVHDGDVLAKMTSTKLDMEREDLLGRIQATMKHIQSLRRISLDPRATKNPTETDRARLGGELKQQEALLKSLEKQRDLLRTKYEKLVVKSPLTGQVITSWTVLEQLRQRPVVPGNVLMTVVDPTKDWELILQLPEERVGHVLTAQQDSAPNEPLQVSYVLKSDPRSRRAGEIMEIDPTAHLAGESGQTVRVRVKIDSQELKETADPLPGITVTARIACGYRPIGYVWFHEVLEFIQAKMFFW